MRSRSALLVVLFPLTMISLMAWGLNTHRTEAAAFIDWMRNGGIAGAALFVAVFAVGVMCMAPIAVLAAAAGFIFGPVVGMCIAPPALVLGASFAFGLGRSVARPWVARRVAADPKLSAIDQAVGRDGLKIALLLRFSPFVPHDMLNYALGVTQLRLRDFVIATFVGLLPLTCLQVYAGSLARDATEVFRGGNNFGVWSWLLTGVGVAATILVLVVVARIARRELARAMATAAEQRATAVK